MTQVAAETLKVCHYGNPVLREKSKAIAEITDDIRQFAERMISSMYQNDGIGLAAPQVGFNIRLITLAAFTAVEDLPPDASPGERLLAARMPLALVNPEIVSFASVKANAEEGCLSLPGIYGNVERSSDIVIKATLLSGEKIEVECGHLLSRCLQHEIDHLDGVFFIDRMAEDDRLKLTDDLRQLKKKTRRELKKQRK